MENSGKYLSMTYMHVTVVITESPETLSLSFRLLKFPCIINISVDSKHNDVEKFRSIGEILLKQQIKVKIHSVKSLMSIGGVGMYDEISANCAISFCSY